MRLTAAVFGLLVLLAGCSPAPDDGRDRASLPAADPGPEAGSAAESSAPEVSAFIPADFDAPVLVEGEGFRIVPLGPELVKIDFDAYMSSIEHLQSTFTRSTNWPTEGISDEAAMLDMETEQRRFQNRESFAYAVLTPDGTRERGCVYLYPSSKPGYDAEVRMWVTKAEFDAGFDAELYGWVQTWVAEEWPFEAVAYPGRSIDWPAWESL